MTVQELIDELNNLPDKDKKIYCKDLWEGCYKHIDDILLDEDDDPIITIN